MNETIAIHVPGGEGVGPMNCPACSHPIVDPNAGTCPECGAAIERTPYDAPSASVEPPPVQPSAGDPEINSVPFEDRSLPFLDRYWKTLALSFTNPKQLFSGLQDDEFTAPIVYAVVTGTFSGIAGMIWQLVFTSMGGALGGGFGAGDFAFTAPFMVVMMFLLPVMVVIGLFIGSGIYHVCMMIVGVKTRGFGVTLRAVAYGYGPNLLAIVPICGGFIGGIWTLVLTILGGFYGHRTDAWRAVVAYLLPLFLCCGLMMILWFLFMGVAASQGL